VILALPGKLRCNIRSSTTVRHNQQGKRDWGDESRNPQVDVDQS
jgi:hypothetical protein